MSEPRDLVKRGAEAEMLFNTPAFNEALEAVERSVLRGIEDCDWRDTEGLKHYKLFLDCSKAFRALLRGYIQTGKIEERLLQRPKRTLKERVFG